MSEETNKNQYSADSIQALEGMEHVRMRPSMYIGDVPPLLPHRLGRVDPRRPSEFTTESQIKKDW